MTSTLKFFFLSLIFITNISHSQVKWDVPIEELGALVNEKHIIDLKIGETAFIENDSIFCTNKNGYLAVDGLTQTGSGDLEITILKDKAISIKVTSETDLLNDLVFYESFADCVWWTSHKAKFIFVIDNINGKKSISTLAK